MNAINQIKVRGLHSEQCGDWHRSWGLGTNKIGKLYRIDKETKTYLWKGYCQGRHGQTWNLNTRILFHVDFDKNTFNVLESNKKCSLPDIMDVREAVERLNKFK